MLDTENPFRRVVARLEEMAPGLLTNDFPSAAANIGINPADDGVAGVLSASVGLGYQHCNSPVNGACTIVVTDSDLELAQKLSNKLGSWIWEQRTEWIFEEPTAVEALRAGEARGEYPIVIADQGDNTGGGAPGDPRGMQASDHSRLVVARNWLAARRRAATIARFEEVERDRGGAEHIQVVDHRIVQDVHAASTLHLVYEVRTHTRGPVSYIQAITSHVETAPQPASLPR